jgi:hypothetical protein
LFVTYRVSASTGAFAAFKPLWILESAPACSFNLHAQAALSLSFARIRISPRTRFGQECPPPDHPSQIFEKYISFICNNI